MIRLIYYSICIAFVISVNYACDAPIANTGNATPEPVSSVRIPKNDIAPFVKEEQKTEVPKPVSRIQKRKVIKDSVEEPKVLYAISDEIIDSLNNIQPLYDQGNYNQLAVSYFSTLADSLHGRSYFADNSDAVMLSVMDILTSRLNEGTDIVFLVDKTGSMDDDIENVRNSLHMIMDYLSKFNNVKVAMAYYGDKNYHHNLWYNRTDLTNDVSVIKDFMETYTTIGNPDVAESVNDGIVRTVEEMDWTPGNRRLMLVIGDAQSQLPPYSSYTQSQVIHKCDSMQVKFNLYPIIIASRQTYVEKVHGVSEFAKVYPNPANEYCHLKLPGNETIFYEINDMTGKKILSSSTNSTGINIQLNNLPSGTYLIQAYNQDYSKFYSKPLIIQH